jgi:hypothetical protein
MGCDARPCEYEYVQVDNLVGYVVKAVEALHQDVVTVGLRVERIEAALGIRDE